MRGLGTRTYISHYHRSFNKVIIRKNRFYFGQCEKVQDISDEKVQVTFKKKEDNELKEENEYVKKG